MTSYFFDTFPDLFVAILNVLSNLSPDPTDPPGLPAGIGLPIPTVLYSVWKGAYTPPTDPEGPVLAGYAPPGQQPVPDDTGAASPSSLSFLRYRSKSNLLILVH